MRNNLFVLLLTVLACGPAAATPATGLQGVVEFEERRVAFELGGRIDRLSARRGSTVRAGEVVATLDRSAAVPMREARLAEVEAARARVSLLRAGARGSDLRAAEAQVRALTAVEDAAGRALRRADALARAGSGPTAQVEDLLGQRDRAAAERAAAEERLRTMRQGARPQEIAAADAQRRGAEQALALEEQRLTRYAAQTPIDGVVLDILAEAGDVVAPGAPVITVADTARPFVDVFVPQARAGEVRLGATARVRVDALPDALAGTVEDISRQTEFTPRFLFSERERPNLVLRVRVRVHDPQRRLRAGLPAFATLEGMRP